MTRHPDRWVYVLVFLLAFYITAHLVHASVWGAWS